MRDEEEEEERGERGDQKYLVPIPT